MVDWKEILRRFLVATAQNDYTWSRPNRRHIDSGLYLPTLLSEGMPPIVFAIDTSGSMNEEALAALWGEIRSAVDEVMPEAVTVIQCDAAVRSIERYEATDLPLDLHARGRGGTLFSPVFEAVEQLVEQPACLIYCTDLGSYDFPPEPDYPVLWAVTQSWGASETPFGERIDIPS